MSMVTPLDDAICACIYYENPIDNIECIYTFIIYTFYVTTQIWHMADQHHLEFRELLNDY